MAAATAVMTAISLASTVVGTIKSFKTAKDMKTKMEDADATATAALDKAKAGLELNFFEEMAIVKTPYDREREAVLSQAAGVLEAGKEGGVRGVTGTAGRVLAAQQDAQADITDRQVDEMMELDTLVASEDSRLRDLKTQISLKESEGAQRASANYEQLRNQATQQGFQGVTSVIQQGLNMVPLFGEDAAGELRSFQSMDGIMPGMDSSYGVGSSTYNDVFSGMKVGDYRKWKKALTPTQEKMYFQTPEFRGAYDMNKTTYDFMNPFLQTMNLKYGSKENKGEL